MRLVSDDDLGIITVFQEAEGEPYEGKVAVAEVILRRTERKYMSDGTIAGTVLRRYQFSGFNTESPNRVRSFKVDTEDQNVSDCARAWSEAKAGSNLVPDCLHYLNPKLCEPSWVIGATVVKTIGNHKFLIVKE